MPRLIYVPRGSVHNSSLFNERVFVPRPVIFADCSSLGSPGNRRRAPGVFTRGGNGRGRREEGRGPGRKIEADFNYAKSDFNYFASGLHIHEVD